MRSVTQSNTCLALGPLGRTQGRDRWNAAGVVDESNAGGFGARQAWLYVTILTVGSMVSRGFAESGRREPYTADDRS